MTASLIDRGNVKTYPFGQIKVPVAADAVIPAGVLVSKPVDGYATNADSTVTDIVLGVSLHSVDATGFANGDKTCDVRPGKSGPYVNSDTITEAHIGQMAYAVDNQTVAKASTGGPPAGVIWAVDATGVYIDVAPLISSVTTDAEAAARVQAGTGTLVAGVLTVAAGVVITANSRITAMRKTNAGTVGDALAAPAADRTVGAAGVGAFTLRAYLDGVAATSDTSTVDWMIVG